MTEEQAIQKKFSIRDRVKSFGFAYRGMRIFILTQHNAWVHIAAAIITTCAGIYFSLSGLEWCMVAIAIGIVLIAECMNTAIEFLTDLVSPEFDVKAGTIKDLAAAAVLLASLTALAVGAIVFIPHILALLQK